MAAVENGRSILDKDLEAIDSIWGDTLPVVSKMVQKLWGVPVPAMTAMRNERAIARAIADFTLEGEGKDLSAEGARILLKLAPCVETGPYGAGVDWLDIPDVAKALNLNEGHVRRMIINDKITLDMIHRPSAGNMAKKRWVLAESIRR